ncbi:MAG: homoserine dehydrogenase [Proteobacteria bacterium]|nr:homoserine dehydrogenase [Pseudomonadota bacterium]
MKAVSKPLRIAIAGLGTVGAGTFSILTSKSQLLQKRAGKSIEVAAVSARSKAKKRNVKLNKTKWVNDALSLASMKEVDVVVELIGGASGVAYELCKTALKNKKSVVTANKAMIAAHGLELATLAEKNGVKLLCEAAVAGGIPLLKSIREGLAGNTISRVAGILNGTCNYILTAMDEEKRSFDDVLKEAQKLGYAEADPSFDIDGIDASHKLSILTALAFGCPVNMKAMSVEGITKITLSDIAYAGELGYKIRLLGITEQTKHGILQRVHPAMIPLSSPISRVRGVLNAATISTDSLGNLFLEGAGAGAGPTASAVVADIVDIAAGRGTNTFNIPASELKAGKFTDIKHRTGAYYLRLTVADKAGVLSAITKVLSKEKISVETLLQPAAQGGKRAEIIIITHTTTEAAMEKALHKMRKMAHIVEQPQRIRIEA